MSDEKLKELQLIEQNSQQYQMQRQQFQTQLAEIESALDELKATKESYKIIGNIMVKTDKESLEKDLNEKKQIFELRISTLEKQEGKLKDKAKELRAEVMSGMEDGTDKQSN